MQAVPISFDRFNTLSDGDAHERAAAVEADALAGGGVARRVVVRDHEGPGDVVGAGPVDRGDLVAARVDDLARGPVAGAAGSPALGAVDDHRRAHHPRLLHQRYRCGVRPYP